MRAGFISRRTFVRQASLAGAVVSVGGTAWAAAKEPAGRIETTILWNGRKAGRTWFHPRACLVPATRGKGFSVFMTLQEITGSDVFGQVHWTISHDGGKSWTDPEPIAALARHDIAGGLQEGVCDVVPQYHPATGTVLAMGHNVYYQNGKLAKPAEDRWPVYAVRDAAGKWSEACKVQWDDPRSSAIFTCGCGERLLFENGDLLVPISFGPKGRTNRSVTSLRCAFDGKTVTVKQAGNELVNAKGRGLLEPSVVKSGGEYWLTIRAEDERGYVARSKDGLQWSEPKAWTWDDGEPLTMSTTQQHWLPHSEGLHLVYTRKAKENGKVFRWRAPVYVARVDAATMRLQRSSERIAFPLDDAPTPAHVARMGNFHPLTFSPEQSWITTGEERPDDGWKGDLLLARVRWNITNRLAPNP